MNTQYSAKQTFSHGEVIVEGTLIFVLGTCAQNEKRDGYVSTEQGPLLKEALISADLRRTLLKKEEELAKLYRALIELNRFTFLEGYTSANLAVAHADNVTNEYEKENPDKKIDRSKSIFE